MYTHIEMTSNHSNVNMETRSRNIIAKQNVREIMLCYITLTKYYIVRYCCILNFPLCLRET